MKVLKKKIGKNNLNEAIKYCREFAQMHHKDLSYAAGLYNTIKEGRARIYIYEDGTLDYKRIK